MGSNPAGLTREAVDKTASFFAIFTRNMLTIILIGAILNHSAEKQEAVEKNSIKEREENSGKLLLLLSFLWHIIKMIILQKRQKGGQWYLPSDGSYQPFLLAICLRDFLIFEGAKAEITAKNADANNAYKTPFTAWN